jgi:uncharacterized repeat protein (TIGR01451 family)
VEATTSVEVWAPIIGLFIEQDGTEVRPGSTVNFTIHLSNAGRASALNVWVNLTLAQEFLVAGQSSNGTWAPSGAVQTWHFTDVAPGEVQTISLTLRARFNTPPGTVVALFATVTYTDSFGLADEQLVSSTYTVTIPSDGSPIPWYYFLSLLASVPVVAYRRLRLPNVQEVFVVYRDGSLLAHQSRTSTTDKDEDVLMAMFTAIQEFIRESFSYGTTRELKAMNLGDHSVEIQRGEHLYLAVIFSGKATPGLNRRLVALVDRMEREYAGVLKDWSGNMDHLKGLDKLTVDIFPRRVRRFLEA